MSRLCLIPARGGSVRLPRKNILDLGGKPLIAHTIEAAIESRLFDRIDVSTDDDEIAEAARRAGARVPYMRPERLSTNDAGIIDVLLYHLDVVSADDTDLLVILQPTAPFRRAEHIAAGVRRYADLGCETLVTVSDFSHPPQWAFGIENGLLKRASFTQTPARSQHIERMYCPTGSIIIGSAGVFRDQKSLYARRTGALYMDRASSLDIDDEFDLAVARALIAARKTGSP